jgi:2-oxoglutarate ferredoxin oxidoreductase subunit alpha
MPAMILADGTMGQMMEPVELDFEVTPPPAKPWATNGTKMQRKHNIVNSLSLVPEELEKFNFERFERYKQVEENEALYEEYFVEDAEIIVTAYGIASRVAKNAVDEARKKGIKVGLVRPITVWPFPKKPFEKIAKTCKHIVCVELSMGQMIEDVKLAVECKVPVTLCNRAGGMIPSTEQVLGEIEKYAVKGE